MVRPPIPRISSCTSCAPRAYRAERRIGPAAVATKSFGLPMRVRITSALYALPGLGFGLGTVGTLAYLVRNGELPMTPFGWRLMGTPLVGMDRFNALGWALALALVGTSTLDVIAAI